LSPILFSNNHPLSSFYTSYVDKVGFIRASFISFLFLHHRLGRRSSPTVPITGPVPSIPYPSLATILKHRSCPLQASSPSRVCSANPTNDITASAFLLQRHPSISCQVARLTLLVVHWSHSDSSTPLSNFLFLYPPCSKQNSILCFPECLAS
jgi:hypothetical protein